MNDSQLMWHLYKYKEKEWLCEAEKIRLRQRHRLSRKKPNPAICFLINKTGYSLGSWGMALQQRCQAAAS
jgi:hypothetical protein